MNQKAPKKGSAEARMRDWEVAQPTLIYRAPPQELLTELVNQSTPEVPPTPPPGTLTKLAALIRAAEDLKARTSG